MDLERDETRRRHLGIRKARLLGEALDAWLRSRDKVEAGTLATNVTVARRMEAYFGRTIPVHRITTQMLQVMVNDQATAGGYAASTLSTQRSIMSAFFGWCGGSNPARALELPQVVRTEDIYAWSDRDIGRLRTEADRLGCRILLEALVNTGVRVAEAAALRWEDFDPATSTVRVTRQFCTVTHRFRHPKGKRPRTAVVLPDWWQHYEQRTGLLFPDRHGPVRVPRLARRIDALLTAAGLNGDGRGPHDARRTYGRLFLELGGWMDELQTSLGHASIKTTEQQYGAFAAAVRARYAVERMRTGRSLRLLG